MDVDVGKCKKNPLPDDYSPKLKKLKNGLEFDERAIDYLNEMLSDAKHKDYHLLFAQLIDLLIINKNYLIIRLANRCQRV